MTNKLVGAAAIILDAKGDILLVKHNYGKFNWELPGGLSEKNESAEATAIREVLEETGLHVNTERLTGVYYEDKHDMHHFCFKCSLTELKEPSPDLMEVTEIAYFNVNQLPRPISDFTIKRITDALNASQDNPLFHQIGARVWYE